MKTSGFTLKRPLNLMLFSQPFKSFFERCESSWLFILTLSLIDDESGSTGRSNLWT
jgi:hypothetical protein